MKQDKVRLSEGQLKRQIEDYLIIQENMGNLAFERVNAGAFPTQSGRWAVGARKGTADYHIDKADSYDGNAKFQYCRSIWVELKGFRGVQTQSQKEFQKKIEVQHGEYYIVKSFEELQEVLNG